MTESIHKRRSHWFQFSLRTFLVLAIAIAIGVAYLGTLWGIRVSELGVVERLSEAGGAVSVTYSESWFFGLIPGRITAVSLWGNKTVPVDPFRELLRFPKLESIDISLSNVGPRHFDIDDRNDSIQKLMAILCHDFDDRSLELCSTQFRSLTFLDVQGATAVTDRGGTFLGELKQLRELNVCGTDIGDPTIIEVLTQCRMLEELNANHTEIGSAAVPHLISHPSLTHVDILYTNIEADALAKANGPTSIRRLTYWSKTPVKRSVGEQIKVLFPDVDFTIGPLKRRED